MAQDDPAMTLEAAAAAIAEVRGYREELTRRAAGLIWMVWGLALAVFASAEAVALVDTPYEDASEGLSVGTPGFGALLLVVLCLAGGAVATNAVWKAHALERGARHRSWIAWVGIVALVVFGIGVGMAGLYVAVESTQPLEGGYVYTTPLVAAGAAVGIALLQKNRVSPWPGHVAAAAMVGLEFLLPALVTGSLEHKVLASIQWTTAAILASFFTVGLWLYRRG